MKDDARMVGTGDAFMQLTDERNALEEVLRKYIAYVDENEGIDYLGPRHRHRFTPAEWAMLQRLRPPIAL